MSEPETAGQPDSKFPIRTVLLAVVAAAVVGLQLFGGDSDIVEHLVVPPFRLAAGAGLLWVAIGGVMAVSKQSRPSPLALVDVALAATGMLFKYPF